MHLSPTSKLGYLSFKVTGHHTVSSTCFISLCPHSMALLKTAWSVRRNMSDLNHTFAPLSRFLVQLQQRTWKHRKICGASVTELFAH